MYRIRNIKTNTILKIMLALLLFLIATSVYKSIKINILKEDMQITSEYIEAMVLTNQQINIENRHLKEQLDYEIDAISELEENVDMLNKELTLSYRRIEELENEKNQFLDGIVDYSDDRQFRKGYIDMSELEMLERIAESEATGHGVVEKMNVLWTILNRMDNNNFPNTIEKVIFQKNQYSPVWDGRYNSVIITDSSKEAVNRVLNGEGKHDSLYFIARESADESNVTWFDTYLQPTFIDNCHEYFK